jgi:hypothetical protein
VRSRLLIRGQNGAGLWTPYPASGSSPPPPPPGGQGTGISSSDPTHTDIRQWCRLPGDLWYQVPNGTYTAGQLSDAVHPATGGRYGGWVVLVAETPGSVIVDMSPPGDNLGGGLTANGDLIIDSASQRIMFVGFKFIDGTLTIDAPKIRGYYTDHQFSVASWTGEPGFNISNPFSSSNYHHWGNRAILTQSHSIGFDLIGSDLHNSSTAYYPQAGARTHNIIGCDFYNISNGNYYGDSGGDHGTHPDCGGLVGGNYDGLTITDCHLHPGKANGGIAGIVADGDSTSNSGSHGPITNFTLSRVWIHNLSGVGLSVGGSSTGSGKCLVTGTDFHVWDCNDAEIIYWLDGVDVAYTLGATIGDNSRVLYKPTSSTQGVAQTGTDPATAWRAVSGHAVGDWATYFASNWP